MGTLDFPRESKYEIRVLRVVWREKISVYRNPKNELLRGNSCQNGDKKGVEIRPSTSERPYGRTAERPQNVGPKKISQNR